MFRAAACFVSADRVHVDHRLALNSPALLSAPSKKSFSSVSSPILACSVFTSTAGCAAPAPVWSKNSSEAPRPFTPLRDGNNARARPVSRGFAQAPHDKCPFPEGTAGHCPSPGDFAPSSTSFHPSLRRVHVWCPFIADGVRVSCSAHVGVAPERHQAPAYPHAGRRDHLPVPAFAHTACG